MRLGFSVHTGWAAMIAVGGTAAAPTIAHRARLQLSDPDDERSRFVYHAARDLAPRDAARFVRTHTDGAHRRARAALAAAIADLEVAAAGLIVGNAPLDASLAEILASHSLIHTAEGALFRGAIAAACEALHIPVVAVPAKTLGALPAKLDAIGRAAGPPWSKDQKDGLLAALSARAPARAP